MALTHFFSMIASLDDAKPDGAPRESLLGQCRPAQRLRLIREPGPPFDDGTVAVCLPSGVPLGYVRERATDKVSRWLDEGAHVDVFVTRLTGGAPGQPVGCILLVVAANDDESEEEILAYVREQLEVAARLREILAAPPHAPAASSSLHASSAARWRRVRAWVHRHQRLIPIPCFALVLLTPPLGLLDSRLDLAFDIGGSAAVAVGLWLRLWTSGHAHDGVGQDRFALPSTSPYAYMRHPRPLARLLIGFGCVVFTESGPGLFLITAVLVAVYRVATAVEEESLAARFGAAYAEHCARVPHLPRPSIQLLRAAASISWQAVRLERRFVAGTLLLAGLADASEVIPRLFG